MNIRDKHCLAFLQLLFGAAGRGQPVSADQLAAISRNHTARISDLRAQGHDIVCERLNGRQTQYRYRGQINKAVEALLAGSGVMPPPTDVPSIPRWFTD